MVSWTGLIGWALPAVACTAFRRPEQYEVDGKPADIVQVLYVISAIHPTKDI